MNPVIDRLPARRSIPLLVLLGTAFACDREAKPGSSDEGAEPAAKASAKKAEAQDEAKCEAETYQPELTAQCEISATVLAVPAPAAPWKGPASAPPSDAVALQVTTEGVVAPGWWGAPLPVAEFSGRFYEALDGQKRVAEMTGKPAPSWSLVIADDVKRADVAAVFGVLTRGRHPPNMGMGGLVLPTKSEGTLVLATDEVGTLPQPRKPEMLAALHTELSSADPSQKAMTFANKVKAAMPKCPAVEKTFAALATAAPDARCALLARGVSEGLAGCNCPEADEFLTLLYAISVGTQVPVGLTVARSVTLDPKGESRPGATWAEVVAGLDEAALGSLWVAP